MLEKDLYFKPECCEKTAAGLFYSDSFSRWALTDSAGNVVAQPDYVPDDLLPYYASSGAFYGPSLHIIVVTLACNHACIYCRVAPVSEKEKGTAMTEETARRSVEMAFNTPNDCLTIEFQGGEALLNWPAVSAAIIHARELNRERQKDLRLAIVTNLSMMDEQKFRFLVENGVSVCTSLDGPAMLHNKNRVYGNAGGHSKALYWLDRLNEAAAGGGPDSLPSALMTTTRHSLSIPELIVEQYRELGLGGIFIRPLSPIGHAGTVWDRIGYSPKEYKLFYARSLKKVLDINKAGELFVERNAALFARKLFDFENPNYLDLKSPCGASTGQLAYNWNGDIYTCDEGRMLSNSGDEYFRLGSVYEDSFKSIIRKPLAIRLIASSLTELRQPMCSRCPSSLYCRVPPVYNYITQGNIHGNMAANERCRLFRQVYDMLSEKNSVPENAAIFRQWSETYE